MHSTTNTTPDTPSTPVTGRWGSAIFTFVEKVKTHYAARRDFRKAHGQPKLASGALA